MNLSLVRAHLLLGAFFMANLCHAGPINTDVYANLGTPLNNANSAYTVSINNGDGGATAQYNYSGAIPWTQSLSHPTNPALGPTFYTFCIELTQDVNIGSTNDHYIIANLADAPKPGTAQSGHDVSPGNPVNQMGTTKADAISRLWNGFYGTSQAQIASNSPASLLNGAAFQLAIWTIEYDMDSSGHVSNTAFLSPTANFRASSTNAALVTLAENLLHDVDTSQTNADKTSTGSGNYSETALLQSGLHLIALTSDGANGLQDQVTVCTPEPSSLMLAFMGGLAVTAVGYKRRKQCPQLS